VQRVCRRWRQAALSLGGCSLTLGYDLQANFSLGSVEVAEYIMRRADVRRILAAVRTEGRVLDSVRLHYFPEMQPQDWNWETADDSLCLCQSLLDGVLPAAHRCGINGTNHTAVQRSSPQAVALQLRSATKC